MSSILCPVWTPGVKFQPVVTQHPTFNSCCWHHSSFTWFILLNKVSVCSRHGMEMWQRLNQGSCGEEWPAFTAVRCSILKFSCHLFLFFLPCCLYFWRLIYFTTRSGWSFIRSRWMLLQKIKLLWDGSAEDEILGAACNVYPLCWFTASLNSWYMVYVIFTPIFRPLFCLGTPQSLINTSGQHMHCLFTYS